MNKLKLIFFISIFFFVKTHANTISVCIRNKYINLNPHSGKKIKQVTSKIYETLVDYKEDQYLPRIAESWDISNDNKTYRLTLKEKIKFHANPKFTPSRYLNAEDVVASYQFLKEYLQESIKSKKWDLEEKILLDNINNIKSIIAIDKNTVEFNLEEPADLMQTISDSKAVIISKEYLDKGGYKNHYNPIGTGEFYLHKIQYLQHITIKKNQQYHIDKSEDALKKEYYIDKINFIINQNNRNKVNQISQKNCQIAKIDRIVNANIAKKKQQRQIGFFVGDYNSAVALIFNSNKAPFKSKSNRKKIRKIINTKSIIKNIYLLNAQKSDIFPEENIRQEIFSNEDKPIEIKINIGKVCKSSQKEMMELASILQQNFKTHNIKLTHTNDEKNADLYLVNFEKRSNNYSWIHRYIEKCNSSKNNKNWCHAKYSYSLQEAGKENMKQINNIIKEEAPVVFIAEKPDIYIYNKIQIQEIHTIIKQIY